MLEGDFLVGEGVQHDLADVGDQGREVSGGVDADAQGQGVDEEPDQVGGVGVVAAGDGGADGEVAPPGLADQEQAPDGEQDDEVGGGGGRAGGVEPVRDGGVGGGAGVIAGEAGAVGRWVVGGGAGGGGAVERLLPPGLVVVGVAAVRSRCQAA